MGEMVPVNIRHVDSMDCYTFLCYGLDGELDIL